MKFYRESLSYFCLQIPLPLECMHVTSLYGGIHLQSSVFCEVPPSDWQLQKRAAKLLKILSKNLLVGPSWDLMMIRVCRTLSFLWVELHLVFWMCVGWSSVIIRNLPPQKIFHQICSTISKPCYVMPRVINVTQS